MDEYLKGYYTQALVTEVNDYGVKAIIQTDEGEKEEFFEADTVILAAGLKAKAAECNEYQNLALEVIRIGDCLNVKDVLNATHTAYEAVIAIDHYKK